MPNEKMKELATAELLKENHSATLAELVWLDYDVVEQGDYLPFCIVTGTLCGEPVSVQLPG